MLAELAEISERTVSDIKNGKIVSKYNNIIKISCILKVPNNYLLSDRCAFDKPGTISNILEIMSELTHDDIQHFILYIDFYKNEKKFFIFHKWSISGQSSLFVKIHKRRKRHRKAVYREYIL